MTKQAEHGHGRRVLMLLSNCFDPDPRVHAEARALADAGWQVTILGWDRDRKVPNRELVDGIAVERITIRSTHGRGVVQGLILPLVQLGMIARGMRKRFDVVHAHDFDTLAAGYTLSRLRRKPLVYDAHEDYAGMLHGNIPAFLEKWIRRAESFFLRRLDLLITVGEILRDDLARRGARRSVVVGNWKDLGQFRLGPSARTEIRAQLGIPGGALVIVFIANLGRERHIRELIDAVIKHPDIHLIIGGTGPMAEHVRFAAREALNIHFLGFVPPKLIGRYTNAADILFYAFDLSSPNARYSAPNKLFEALAAGCALITGDFGEIGKIVRDVRCGVILREFSEDSISHALNSCSDLQTLDLWKRRAAQAGQETYNWGRARSILLSAYESLAQSDSVSVVRSYSKQKVVVP